jgi:hypothetical protein
MRRASILAGALLAAASLATGRAADDPAKTAVVENLTANGFEVVKRTAVMGDFDGCDYDRQVQLKGGGVFTCSGFGYMHAHNPTAVLLKKKDANAYKLVIKNVVYDGKFAYG